MRFEARKTRAALITLCMSLAAATPGEAAKPATAFSSGKKNFEQALQLIKNKYYQAGLTDDDIYEAATKGLIEFIQPQTAWDKLLSKEEYDEMMRSLDGKVAGVGVMLTYSQQAGTADVANVLPGTPAAKAGVLAGDRILKVDGKTFKNEPFVTLVQAIRGSEGKNVKITLLRDASIRDVELKREEITWDSAAGEVIGKTGVLRIRAFTKQTPEQARQALTGFTKANVSSIVVDLRGNSGGSLDSAFEVMELFAKKGTKLAQISARSGKTEVRVAKQDGLLGSASVIVLMNKDTACGAELLAALLKDARQAKFIGENTTGKWSVQRVEPLANGFAVKYTTAMLAPGNRAAPANLNEQGPLAPDVEVRLAEDADPELISRMDDQSERLQKDTQLRAALEMAN